MENRGVAIQFNLPQEYFVEKESLGFSALECFNEIEYIMKKRSFKQEILGFYTSSKANSVIGVITAQELIKIPLFKKYVRDFKMYLINEVDSLNNIEI